MTIYLIRHGETALNVARVVQPADTPLSARGQMQAQALGTRLAALGIRAVLSSDLPRALQTAQAVGRACGLAVATSALLHERNFGDWRGQAYDGLGFDPITQDDTPPNGESMAVFETRCAAAWTELLACHAAIQGPLAVVCHGLVLRSWLHRGPLTLDASTPAPHRLGNTSVTITSATVPHQVSLVNCTAHLTGPLAEDERSLSGG